jgi:hypothetical protein
MCKNLSSTHCYLCVCSRACRSGCPAAERRPRPPTRPPLRDIPVLPLPRHRYAFWTLVLELIAMAAHGRGDKYLRKGLKTWHDYLADPAATARPRGPWPYGIAPGTRPMNIGVSGFINCCTCCCCCAFRFGGTPVLFILLRQDSPDHFLNKFTRMIEALAKARVIDGAQRLAPAERGKGRKAESKVEGVLGRGAAGARPAESVGPCSNLTN